MDFSTASVFVTAIVAGMGATIGWIAVRGLVLLIFGV